MIDLVSVLIGDDIGEGEAGFHPLPLVFMVLYCKPWEEPGKNKIQTFLPNVH